MRICITPYDHDPLQHVINEEFMPFLKRLVEALEGRVLPAFDSIGDEGKAKCYADWEKTMSRPSSGDEDPSDYVEQTIDVGVVHYMEMEGVRQSLLNLFAPALYHAWEQQLFLFYRRLMLSLPFPIPSGELKVTHVYRALLKYGIDIKSFKPWAQIDELRLTANTVKHTAGKSYDELVSRRPDLFIHPILRGAGQEGNPWAYHAEVPLGGGGFYVTLDDLKGYRDALVRFWEEMSEGLHSECK